MSQLAAFLAAKKILYSPVGMADQLPLAQRAIEGALTTAMAELGKNTESVLLPKGFKPSDDW